MATRSRIGIVNDDGTVSSIYCHWDGYPEGNGKRLVEHYTDRNKVRGLIDLGSISSLGERVSPEDPLGGFEDGKAKSILERLNPKEDHSFDNPAQGVTVAYGRDRGESDEPRIRIDKSADDFYKSDVEEYGYLFTEGGEWVVCYTTYDEGKVVVQPVNEVLAKDL